MNFTKFFFLTSFVLSLFSTPSVADTTVWTDESTSTLQVQKNGLAQPVYRALRADVPALKTVLSAAPMERMSALESLIDLPLPNGEMHTFVIEESPIMAPALAAKFSDFKSYRVRSANNSGFSGRLDFSNRGFHGYLTTDKGVVFIDPQPGSITAYRSAYKADMAAGQRSTFSCGVKAEVQTTIALPAVLSRNLLARSSGELRTYRLAVAATREYSLLAPGAAVTQTDIIANTQSAIGTAINRVNEIFERDLAIRLLLIGDNNLLVEEDGSTAFTDNDVALLIDEVAPFINPKLTGGATDYDIGHVFATGGGGLAAFASACGGFKADGVTSSENPEGDSFYIDFVAHEIGHQLGADHTFNGSSGSCLGTSRTAQTAVEPGSGSTIMAYAGICPGENVQANSDATFHAKSISQIHAFTHSGAGRTCGLLDTTLANTAPEVNAGNDFTIPKQTPFALTGSATDINTADTLTYQWDQMDTGLATNAFSYGTDLGSNPLFRSFSPSTSPVRTLPQITTLVSGNDDEAEKLPDQARTMNFRLTVRDQNSGVNEDDVQLTVAANAGPFRVLSPGPGVILNVNESQVIEWRTACTEQAPVNCANVDILLSTDSGASFSETLLAATPNDGVATISFPDVSSTSAIIKIACSDNIFFDLNDGLFSLQAGGSGIALTRTGAGGTKANCEVPTIIVPDGSGGGGGGLNLWLLLAFFPLALLRRKLR